MELNVSPDQGYWKGATFKFSIKVPDMYPHEPPKVRLWVVAQRTIGVAQRSSSQLTQTPRQCTCLVCSGAVHDQDLPPQY